jgi:hypothetical protein
MEIPCYYLIVSFHHRWVVVMMTQLEVAAQENDKMREKRRSEKTTIE